MKKKIWSVLFYAGFGLLMLSIVFMRFLPDAIDTRVIDFILGFGIAIMLVGLIFILIHRYSPEGAKQYEIEEKDERNIRIKEKAAYSSWYASFAVFGIIAITFLILGFQLCAWITVAGAVLHRLFLEIFKAIYKKKM